MRRTRTLILRSYFCAILFLLVSCFVLLASCFLLDVSRFLLLLDAALRGTFSLFGVTRMSLRWSIHYANELESEKSLICLSTG
jgi:hypothetical protein